MGTLMPTTTVNWYTDRSVRIHPVNRHAIPDLSATIATALPHTLVRAGLDSIVVETHTLDPELHATVTALLNTPRHLTDQTRSASRHHIIPVHYNGADLTAVAHQLDLTVDALIAAHTSTTWCVAMIGFAPGFPYLLPIGDSNLNPNNLWEHLPRLDNPRTHVPAGTVAVAAGMSAIYPRTMPGGWNLLGTTSVVLFNPDNPIDPTYLQPTDTVTFQAVT